MKTFPFPRLARRRNTAGVALIIVLSLVVLLTTVIVAFFARAVLDRQTSSSSAGVVKADVLARGALDEIVLDLKQEIAAGSRVDTPPTSTPDADRLTLYLPKPGTSSAASTVTPALVPSPTSSLTPLNPANVLKRSVFKQPFFDGASYDATNFPPSNLASAVNSAADPAPDGRYVSGTRWNKPLLLDPGQIGGDAGKSAAVYNNYFAAPDWVLVTRGGPKAFSAWQDAAKKDGDLTNMDYVVGRYAYVVYDEGGLLDINQAGFPSSLANDADFTARRGRLAQVDLTGIPGVTNADAIVTSFRNAKTAADTASYKKYVLNNTPANPGFLRVVPGDQTFLSRQDLLNFQRNNPSALGAAALQYLGTFSREVNAPTWVPPANATDYPVPAAANNGPSNIYAYKDNAENGAATVKNRDLTTVRFTRAGTMAATNLLPARTVVVGEPMLKRRFLLDRLSWVGRSGPANGANSADVKRAFGLRFISQGVWQYTSPDSDALATTIKTLNEVASLATPREPDFFELLQAGILSGSLGLYSGDRNYADTRREDKSAFRHIIQIGVNLIDQYDADSFPTTIQFDFSGDSPSLDARLPDNLNVVGIEDLPYFSQVGGILYRDDNGTSATREQLYMPVELWNPHQISPTAYVGPDQIRVMVRAGVSIYKKYGATPLYSESPRNFSASPATILIPPDGSSLSLRNLFREPGMLTPSNSTATTETNNVAFTSFGQWQTILGATGKPFSTPATQPELVYFGALTGSPNDPAPTFELQFKNGSDWQTYQVFPALVPMHQREGATNIWPTANQYSLVAAGLRADPRGMRLGMGQAGDYTKIAGASPPNDYQHEANLSSSADPTGADGDQSGTYFGKPKTPAAPYGPMFYPSAVTTFTAENNFEGGNAYQPLYVQNRSTSDASSYTDRDLVIRWGDGDRPNNVKPIMPGHVQDRPIVLNRPFRSVGELGYAYRDVQWKTLDFSTVKSADAALLDLFTVDDADLVAGKVNLNTRQTPVVKALLLGAAKAEANPPVGMTDDEATKLAGALTTTTGAPPPYAGMIAGPLTNPAELATRPSATGNATNWVADVTSSLTTRAKTQREAAVRVLANAGDTRTWNLLVDVIAQSGRYGNNATNLSQFIVSGERRYWLHVAIDRYTGKTVDQILEPVNE